MSANCRERLLVSRKGLIIVVPAWAVVGVIFSTWVYLVYGNRVIYGLQLVPGGQASVLFKSNGPLFDVVLLPDDRIVVGGSPEARFGSGMVWIRNGDGWDRCDDLSVEGQVHAIATDPASSRMIIVAMNTTVVVWDIPTNRFLRTELDCSNCVSSHPSVPYYATGSHDGSVLLHAYNGVPTRTVRLACSQHQHNIRSLGFSWNGQHLASGAEDGTVKLWRVQGNQWSENGSWTVDGVKWYSLSFHPKDTSFLAAGSDGWVYSCHPSCLAPSKMIRASILFSVTAVAHSCAGSHAAIGLSSGDIILADLSKKKIIKSLHGHYGPVWKMRFNNTTRTLISAGQDGTLREWNVEQCWPPKFVDKQQFAPEE